MLFVFYDRYIERFVVIFARGQMTRIYYYRSDNCRRGNFISNDSFRLLVVSSLVSLQSILFFNNEKVSFFLQDSENF